MILTKDELIKMERCSPLLPQPGPEVVEKLMGHIWAQAQTIAELTKERDGYLHQLQNDGGYAELTDKLDAVRELADGLSQVCGDWGRSEGISKRILAILDAPTKQKEAEWQCEVCHSRYDEYVNGCPHCWEAGLRSKVTKPKEACE